ncbi:hypothetical protein [Candidatus Nanohalococcus occultus]|uniref:HTH iclR-type domain-containing protein n=1 Tax=Candidatus Nanohalococcus occultus TaxID=2978047 RepID=A0ABY8CGF8_9ARCH|nr:hypothetical protein SVXNc_0093 [Candidatus Nanohaloarchaeota archaeon SVXNc]
MERAEKVREKAVEIINESQKPSAVRVAQELEMTESDVHRCLNVLEKQKKVNTYTKEVLGARHRMIGVNR